MANEKDDEVGAERIHEDEPPLGKPSKADGGAAGDHEVISPIGKPSQAEGDVGDYGDEQTPPQQSGSDQPGYGRGDSEQRGNAGEDAERH